MVRSEIPNESSGEEGETYIWVTFDQEILTKKGVLYLRADKQVFTVLHFFFKGSY